jgi:hypothetical protein
MYGHEAYKLQLVQCCAHELACKRIALSNISSFDQTHLDDIDTGILEVLEKELFRLFE